MKFDTQIDLYCERLSPGIWAEPLNLFSNLAFIVGAVFIFKMYRGAGQRNVFLEILIGLLFLVGMGSAAFHSLATMAAQIADVTPIALMVFASLYYLLRRLLGLPFQLVAIGFSLFFVLTWFGTLVPKDSVNGSQIYFGAFATLGLIALFAKSKTKEIGNQLIVVWLVLLTALVFRTIDLRVCESFPVGTHFLWHTLNGIGLTLLLRCFVLHQIRLGNRA